MKPRIYLDHNASTPLDPHVLHTVCEELEQELGNPSSIHYHGQQCRHKLEAARHTIARYLSVKPSELTFSSGGTEGANALIRGFTATLNQPSGHIITSDVEHSCVFNTVKQLEKEGYSATYVKSGLWGAVTPESIQAAIRPDTKLITLIAVNNETGVKTDVEAIAKIAHERKIPFFVDAVALLGKEKFLITPGISGMFFSGHKLHAPKGTGFVFCRQALKLKPLIIGGSQEFSRRAGTENLPGIVGFAAAIELLTQHQEVYTNHMKQARDRLEEGLKSNLDRVIINGQGPRVVNTSNISFLGIDGESLLINLDMEGISVSHGSACASGAIEPSRILVNMGTPLDQSRSAIRFSVSRFTKDEEIDHCIEVVTKLVIRMRQFKRTSNLER